MLNSVLIVGVPMVALLAAAFYVFTKSRPESFHGPGGATFRREPWGSGTTNNRQRSTSARRRNARAQRGPGNSSNNQTSGESGDSGFAEEDQCEICFEDGKNVKKVQLYPCNHSDICEVCVNRLLVSNKRECPFCRSRIDGYLEVNTGLLYG